MPGPWTDSQICPNQSYGQHIIVRCKGCNSIHSTKNIGWLNPETKEVSLARSLFDILGTECLCKDYGEFPLIHDCEIDDNLDYNFSGLDLEKGKHTAKTQKAREVLQSWWKKFAESKEMRSPTQQDLDDLVVLVEQK